MALQIDDDGNIYDDGVGYGESDYPVTSVYKPDYTDPVFSYGGEAPVDSGELPKMPDFSGGESQDHDFTKEEAETLWKAGAWDQVKGLGKKALDLFKDKNGKYDLGKLATIGAGLYAATRPNNVAPTGYQGKIPKYTAERNMLNAPPVGRRPGSGGIDYGGGVTYRNPAGVIASSNERSMGDLIAAANSNSGGSGISYFQQNPDVATAYQQNTYGLTPEQFAATHFERFGAAEKRAAPTLAKGGLVSDGFVVPADVVSHLGNGSSEAGLKLLASKFGAEPIKGDGDGMSDSIPTKIDGVQEARVANEEAFISPEMVERLGDGDSRKGAKKLYAMMNQIRKDRTGTSKQGKQIEPTKYMPGGSVDRYEVGGTTTRTVPAGATGSESSLSNWAGDYVTDMLGRGSALAQAPYEAYTGPLTAGTSTLQQQAFTQAGNLKSPTEIGNAATKAGEIASGLASMPNYTAANTNYNKIVADEISSGFKAPDEYAVGTFDNQYKAPGAYETGQFDGGIFNTEQARQYMNPYLQASLEPQLAEARRASDISRLADAGRLTQAGAFGGGRQAIMEAEGRRNLGTKLADITGAGYNTAYTNAMTQFNEDQTRAQTAQKERELSRQFGANREMTAAEMQAKYGLSAQEAAELSRQFAAKNKYDIARTAGEQYLDAQKSNQSANLTAGKYTNDAYLEAQRQNELSRQFGSELGLKADEAAIRGLTAQGNIADTAYRADLAGINALSTLGGVERGIEAEGIAADKKQFEEARLNPFQMLQFEQSLLSGLPLASQSYTVPGQSNFQQFAGGAKTAQELIDILSGKTPAAPVK